MVVIGKSLLIFSEVKFKMAAWWPYWIFWFPDSNFSLALNINSKLKWASGTILMYRRVMCFRGSSVFVGSFPGAFSRARDKISQLTHVYKHLPRVACCLIKMLSMLSLDQYLRHPFLVEVMENRYFTLWPFLAVFQVPVAVERALQKN